MQWLFTQSTFFYSIGFASDRFVSIIMSHTWDFFVLLLYDLQRIDISLNVSEKSKFHSKINMAPIFLCFSYISDRSSRICFMLPLSQSLWKLSTFKDFVCISLIYLTVPQWTSNPVGRSKPLFQVNCLRDWTWNLLKSAFLIAD